MKRVLGVFLGLIALIIVGIVGVFAFSGTGSGPASDLANDAKAAAANAAIDATGLKDKARSASRAAKRASPRRPASAKARSIKPSSSSTSTDGKPPRCPPPPRPPAPSTVTPSASTAPSPPTTIPATSPSRSTARRSRSPSPKARRPTSPTSPTCSSVGSQGKRRGGRTARCAAQIPSRARFQGSICSKIELLAAFARFERREKTPDRQAVGKTPDRPTASVRSSFPCCQKPDFAAHRAAAVVACGGPGRRNAVRMTRRGILRLRAALGMAGKRARATLPTRRGLPSACAGRRGRSATT